MNINTLCSGINDLKKLIMLDNCFSVKFKEKILAELCCLKNLALPVDGFKRDSVQMQPGTSIDLFDNMLNASPSTVDPQTRGFLIYVHYPTLDINSAETVDDDKNMTLRVYNQYDDYVDVPFYCFFGMLGNTITSDNDNVINHVEILNPSDLMVVQVEMLMILVNKSGVKMGREGIGC